MQKIIEKIKEYFQSKGYVWRNVNIPLLLVVLLISLISVFTLWIIGSGYNTDANYKKQLIGVAMGFSIIAIVSLIDYHFLCRFTIFYYVIVTGLVAATRYSPLGTDNGKDAYRWIHLPGFDLQPSELCKIMIIIALAVTFNNLQNKFNTFIPLIIVALITGLPLFFILKQPDLSSSLVIVFIAIIMVFASGIAYKILVPVIAIGVPLVCGGVWYAFQPEHDIVPKYQIGRIMGFLEPEKYPAIMYQQNNSIDAIASGKLYGKFIVEGASEIRNYNRVDVTESDFIWSAIGEEFGFVGCIAIIVILAVFIFLCVTVAKRAVDYLGKMIAIGISAMFMFQVFANIGVATRMLPNTGLPLPFISSGLSSFMAYSVAIGILVNIGLQPATKALGRGFLIKNETRDLASKEYKV